MRYEIVFNMKMGRWEVVQFDAQDMPMPYLIPLKARNYLDAEYEALDMLTVDRYERDNADIGCEFDSI